MEPLNSSTASNEKIIAKEKIILDENGKEIIIEETIKVIEKNEGNTGESQVVNTIEQFLEFKHSIPAGNTGQKKQGNPVFDIIPSCEFLTAYVFNLTPVINNGIEPKIDNLRKIFFSRPSAKYDKATDTITIDVVTFASAIGYQNVIQHGIFYDYSMDNSGAPKMNIYFMLNNPPTSRNSEALLVRTYQLAFSQEQNTTKIIDLSLINTVEVFLIQENPRTSRGTVTTVQPTSN
jgi:hypothetical protein